ncbi:MAG: metallopeptidase family protein [Planctomycetota bacterium]|nr:metallopeptidase family protein [Planctomycetota bacterium]
MTIFREGLLALVSASDDGESLEQRLEREIRITILHEIGPHFGLDEDDLASLGYA